MSPDELFKHQKNDLGGFKLGPMFFTQGDKKMMMMTRPIDAYNFGFDQLISSLKAHEQTNPTSTTFSNIFSSTLNSLIADILNYFQNRTKIKTGKDVKITSIPVGKAQIKKYFDVEINHLIGDNGYKELKKLDEVRGNFQHGNDRYFINYKVGSTRVNTIKDLLEYSGKIKKIINELDEKLESISPSYQVTKTEKDGKIIIESRAIDHSFDLENIKMNKTDK